MTLTLWQAGADYHFSTAGETPGCQRSGSLHTSLAFTDQSQAVSFLRSLMSDPMAANWLRRLALDLVPGLNPQRITDNDVMRELGRLLAAGALLVTRCVLPQAPGVQQEVQAPPRPPQQKAAPPPTARHWIEFKLIDEKTKRFIPEATLKLNLPGRGKEQRTTEAKPLRIDLASAGMAELLEITHLDVWEVVSIQSG